jgi:PAS domain S-box-containing protein
LLNCWRRSLGTWGVVAGAKPLAGRSILVVEDEGLIAPDIVDRLRGAGASVLTAASLDEGLRLARRPDPSAAVPALAEEHRADTCLYRFTDRLFRARSLGAVYEAALDAICEALGCQRAAILMFDASGVTRFVAWRGLSEDYRRAVEGHTPWSKETKDPQPICIADIDSADLAATLKTCVQAEGIGALAFVPLVAKGELVGKFMTYYGTPHTFRKPEVDLAVTIARQLGFSFERMRAEEALHETQAHLVHELAATQQLQRLSTQLIQEDDIEALYAQIVDAAVAIMRSDMASMQIVDAEENALRLLAARGFDAAFYEAFAIDRADTNTSCSFARRVGHRVLVPDVDTCDFIVGTPALEDFRKNGIRAVQSTPLVSRNGRMLGMISTHWRQPHQPPEHALRLLDVLARQAADLIERKESERTAQRLVAIVNSSHDAIISKDLNGIITSWNDAAERLYGYAANEVLGKPISMLIPSDRPTEEARILERVRRGEHVVPYETTRRHKDGTLLAISLSVSPVKDASGRIIGASKIARDITERKEAQARQELLTQEIYHRTKNIFSLVQAVIARSFADKTTVAEAERAVLSRLHSLAQTHVMLVDKNWQGANIMDVVGAEMSPYAGRATIEGPTIMLNAKAAQNFALAVHELATNAAKYGALSNLTGQVRITWSITKPNAHHQFVFKWQEYGGPPVSPPTRKGFGSTVLEQVMAEYFETPPKIEFASGGITYELTGALEGVMGQA